MRQVKDIIRIGNSKGTIIPTNILDWIGADEGTPIILEDDEGKYGRHIHIWKANKEQLAELGYDKNEKCE